MSRVFIAGGHGFLGKYLFSAFSPDSVREHRSRDYDYTFAPQAERAICELQPSVVINAAALTGGIMKNCLNPAQFYIDNLKMGTFLMESAWRYGVEKYVQVGSVCSYPKDGDLPFREKDFWNGYPEATNAPYGLAKKAHVVQAQAYSRQYGFNVINPILANLYGPGDHYVHERSHVIPAIISKFLNAVEHEEKEVVLWGSGNCSREFLYVEDAADAIKFLCENFMSPEIVNVSSGYEIKIKELAEIVATLCGFRGNIAWDISKPDGQPRRSFDTSKLAKLGWNSKTTFAEGIIASVEDCKKWRKLNVSA